MLYLQAIVWSAAVCVYTNRSTNIRMWRCRYTLCVPFPRRHRRVVRHRYLPLMVCSPSHHPIDNDARCLVARFQGALSSPRLARRWRGSLGLPFPYLSSQAVPRRTKPRASAPKPVAASSQFVPRRGGRPLQLARGGGRAPWEEAIAVDRSGLIAVPSVVVERR